jgi:hypothetical protein
MAMARPDLDDLLGQLRLSPAGVSLDGLEAGVWGRVEDLRRAQAQGAGGLRVQLAVAVVALLVGAAVGGASVGHHPTRTESVLLSEDASLAPSVAVEGGA